MEFLKEGVAPVSAGNEPHAQQMRVIIVNFLEHHALVQGATTGQILQWIKRHHNELYVEMKQPYLELQPMEQEQRMQSLVGSVMDTLERWKLVTVDKVGKRRRGNTNASEVWRSAKIAADLEQYLKWLFRKHHADDNRIDYPLRKRRQHGHKGYGYDIKVGQRNQSASDSQAPKWNSNTTRE